LCRPIKVERIAYNSSAPHAKIFNQWLSSQLTVTAYALYQDNLIRYDIIQYAYWPNALLDYDFAINGVPLKFTGV